jgi:xylulokinase
MVRSVQEGVACALRYGFDVMKTLGVEGQRIRASNNNLFLSELFAQTVADLTRLPVELYDTSGSEGAARAAGIGIGFYKNSDECFANLKIIRCHEPNENVAAAFETHYQTWLAALNSRFD